MDGNEVWLVVAAGATFAAFPTWYATMFSGFYLALLLVLFCLIIRVLSFEWRRRRRAHAGGGSGSGRMRSGAWAQRSIWGIGLSAFCTGSRSTRAATSPATSPTSSTSTPFSAGSRSSSSSPTTGRGYLTIRTTGDLRERAAQPRAGSLSPRRWSCTGFLAWTVVVAVDRNDKGVAAPLVPALLGAAALAVSVLVTMRRRSGWAFVLTGGGNRALGRTVFTSLYPRVMVSSTNAANSLTIDNASSSHYTLAVISVVALICLPVILLYQGWTYHVFRARIGGEEPASGAPSGGSAPTH